MCHLSTQFHKHFYSRKCRLMPRFSMVFSTARAFLLDFSCQSLPHYTRYVQGIVVISPISLPTFYQHGMWISENIPKWQCVSRDILERWKIPAPPSETQSWRHPALPAATGSRRKPCGQLSHPCHWREMTSNLVHHESYNLLAPGSVTSTYFLFELVPIDLGSF